jgi:HK97 family phage portal protein
MAGFLDMWKNWFGGSGSEADSEIKMLPSSSNPAYGLISSALQNTNAPRRGTPELLNAYKTLPWLRSVVDRISNATASVKWVVVDTSESNVLRQLNTTSDPGTRQKILKDHLSHATPLALNTPFSDLIENGNPCMTGRQLRILSQTHLELIGEAFLLIERDENGRPFELWSIPPTWVKDIPRGDKPYYVVQHQSLNMVVEDDDMLWMKMADPSNPYGRGTGIGEALGDELDADEYAAKHVKSWFYNRATPDLLVGVKGASEDQLKGAKQAWENNNRGFKRAYGSHWHSGELQVTQLSQTFADQQLVQFREFERDIIVNTFGVPPEILGILENSNRATIESADYLFTRWVIVPRLEFWRTEMQKYLAPMFGDGFTIEYINPVPDDKEHNLSVAKSFPFAFSINEIRAMADHAPLSGDEGEAYWVPLNGSITEDITSDPEEQEEDDLLQEEVEQGGDVPLEENNEMV